MTAGYNGKRVTVVGLARSGVGAANLLAHLGARVTITDLKDAEALESFLDILDPRVALALGSHPEELFTGADCIIVSPGVPTETRFLRMARERGIPLIGELELTAQVLDHVAGSAAPRFLAVTGTNGKSTTTALLHEMIRTARIPAMLGGNIGNSLAAEVLRYLATDGPEWPRYIVAELSSFQLETTDTFKPFGSTILNVTPDHLDRYHAIEPYLEAKCRIALRQGTGDYIVLNADDPMTPAVERMISRQAGERPLMLYFSRQREVDGLFFRDGLIRAKLPLEKLRDAGIPLPDAPDFTLDPAAFRIKGVHNIENAMAAALVALLAGAGPPALAKALVKFPGLEHRLEFVRELDGIRFINDSKGTNVGAVMKSLEGFTEPVILIAGGRDKDSDFTLLRPLMAGRVKRLVLVGDAAEKMRQALGDATDTVMAGHDFKQAVLKAREAATPGDVVLLSPACASFDMFRDFEDRGRRFKELVRQL